MNGAHRKGTKLFPEFIKQLCITLIPRVLFLVPDKPNLKFRKKYSQTKTS